MKTTIILQEELIEKAKKLTQLKTKTDVIHAGLNALIEQYSRQRLSALGGYDFKSNCFQTEKNSVKILVDTSVWIEHFRKEDEHLVRTIFQNRVFVHPFVFGELACGSLKNRTETLLLLQNLPVPVQPTHEEVFQFIEKEKLYGKGAGLVDIHILMSAILTGCALWTFDKKLSLLQRKLKIQSIH